MNRKSKKIAPVDQEPETELSPFSLDLERSLDEVAKKKEFLIAFQEGSTPNLGKALRTVGVSRRLYTSWQEADPDFKALCQEIDAGRIDDIEQVPFDLATSVEVPAQIRLKAATAILKAKRPDEWGDNSSGGGSGPAQIIFVFGKDDPQILDDPPAKRTIDTKAK